MVTIKNKTELIIKDLDEVKSILKSLEDYDTIPEIDIDLIKDKCRKIYDNILNINNFNNEKDAVAEQKVIKKTENKQENEILEDATVTPALQEEKSVEDEAKINTDTVNEEKEEITTESELSENQDEKEDKKEQVIETETTEKEELKETEQKTISDNKTESVQKENVVNISGLKQIKALISEFKNADDLATQLKLAPIDDINSAISINDRIAFVNELFDGDNDLFANCTQKINSLQNIDDAVSLLSEKINFDTENNTHKKFIELIYRRFNK